MYNTTNDISIEQFAAFLDGNLPDDEMQIVADAIDANEEYTEILNDVMQVDETVDVYMSNPDAFQDELLDSEFDLPIIPVVPEVADIVELSVANPVEVNVANTGVHDVHLAMASEAADTPEDPLVSHPIESQATASVDGCDISQQPDETFDLIDLT